MKIFALEDVGFSQNLIPLSLYADGPQVPILAIVGCSPTEQMEPNCSHDQRGDPTNPQSNKGASFAEGRAGHFSWVTGLRSARRAHEAAIPSAPSDIRVNFLTLR
jgi:hypothetical protein